MINPWADAVTLNKAWCLSKKRARALVALPIAPEFKDLVTFNAGKFYGKLQLSHLFTNWKQVPEDYDYMETMKSKLTRKKVINLMMICSNVVEVSEFKNETRNNYKIIYLYLRAKKETPDHHSTVTQDENTTVKTCKKEDDVNCSPEQTKDTTSTDKYSNMPATFSGIPIYILEKP